MAFCCWVSGLGVGPFGVKGSCFGAGEGFLEALVLLLLLWLLLWWLLARPLTAGEKRRDEMDEVSSESLSLLFNGFEEEGER